MDFFVYLLKFAFNAATTRPFKTCFISERVKLQIENYGIMCTCFVVRILKLIVCINLFIHIINSKLNSFKVLRVL